MAKADNEHTLEQQSAVLDFRLPDWTTLGAAFDRIADLYGSRDDLSASELYRALLEGQLRAGEVQVQRNGPPLRRLLEPASWRRFGGIYADREGKPRFLPVPRGVGGMAVIPVVRQQFFVRCSDLNAHYPTVGQIQAETKTKPATESSSSPVTETAVTKEALAQQGIQELYGCHPYKISKKEIKTGTVKTAINTGREQRDRFSWDTINRALGRDKRRKK